MISQAGPAAPEPAAWAHGTLHPSDLHFHRLLEKLPAGAYTCDPDGLITYFNQHAVQIWGREPYLHDPRDRFCGSFRLFATDGAPIPHDACWMALALKTGQEYNGREIMIEHPNGRRLAILAHANPIYNDDGTLQGAVNVLVDISAQKQAEEARRQFEAQIQHAQKLESLGVLAGGIAHDFNNLLTAMLGYASLAALELPHGSTTHQMLVQIQIAAQRAANLARQMLAYSGRGTLVTEPLQLDQLVRELATLLGAVISKKATLDLQLEPVVINGDTTQLSQVIMNLITNASEALEGHSGRIRVCTRSADMQADALRSPFLPDPLPAGRYAVLEVTDTGAGMAPETLARIFDPFFSTRFTGRGLGLAAVLGIVRGHGGAIQVASEPGQGTTMSLLFPTANAKIADSR